MSAERTLSANMIALMNKGVLKPAIFIYADFPSNPRRIWTGRYDYTDGDGHVWKGIGAIISAQSVAESMDSGATGISVQLNGLDPTIYDQIVNDDYQDHEVDIWLALWDPATGLIEMPSSPTWKGVLDSDSSDMSPGTIQLTVACETRMADILRKRSWKYTDADQQTLHPTAGDTGMSKITQIIGMNIPWGKAGSPTLTANTGLGAA
jgi:hypothetical protein